MGNVTENANSKRVLVTGASGFVGRPLITALLRAGYKVRAAARRATSFPDSVEVCIVPDFKTAIDWKPILQGVNIVIHLAGLAHADSHSSTFNDYDQINWKTTLDLARAAKDVGLDRFIFLSSVRAQVGPSAPHVLHERDYPTPTDHYGQTKLAAELAVGFMGLPFTIFRPVAIYGPQPKGNIKILVQIAKFPLPLPFAGFNNRRSLLGIDNLISAFFFVLNNKATVGETFLVADPVPLTLSEIFTMLRKAHGRRPGLVHISPTFIRLALCMLGQKKLWERISEDLVADTSKLESLGWHPAVGTYEGFCSMLSADNANDIGQHRKK